MSDVLMLLCAAAIAVALRLFVLSVARIRGSSMLPTLRSGCWAFVWRLTCRFRPPRRGDVVICHFPGRRVKKLPFLRQNFVKRVIGLPGDMLEVVEGVVHINGQPLEEAYLDPARTRFFRLRSRPPVTLGPDEYYLMGDNRDASNDSRAMGPVRRRDILGRVPCTLFPPRRVR